MKRSFSVVALFIGLAGYAQKQITIAVNKPVTAVSPTMWGIFFEDINFAADGGLYAEMVKNRSFEFYNPFMGWTEIKGKDMKGKMLFINVSAKSPQNTRIARVTVDPAVGLYGIANEGFRGMGVRENKQYNFTMLGQKTPGAEMKVRVDLVSSSGVKIGSTTVEGFPDKWGKLKGTLTSTATDEKAHLELYFQGKGTVDVDMISLFPVDTWKNRSNGLRPDLVQKLADLKPGFLRFPGGCIVEGHELETRYQWKRTVGTVENRTPIINRWNTEFKQRATSDYFQSFGMGFFEYFQLAEDIGAEPLPILNCGMACQFNTAEVAPLDMLDPYVQDALDLVEFANGSDTSKWGKVRAEMGHPKPFNLKLMGVGNEQWDEQYIERYKVFAKALKDKYPEIQLISAAGPNPEGPRFDYAWKELRALNADLIDEHYYQNPQWFFSNASRYDNYPRSGPKVFAGEYASHGKDTIAAESKNTWISALSEAAFMTGLERNADVVKMASYAPLFAHVEAWQWRPDLIWYDNLRSVATPNYWVQKLFSNYKGTAVVPALTDGKALAGSDSVFASAVVDKPRGEVIIKMVNISSLPVTYKVNIGGAKMNQKQAKLTVLASNEPLVYNTLDKQDNVSPVEKPVDIRKDAGMVVLSPMSVNVLVVPCNW
jgi:alpha-N-arabinofuranosidase